VKFRVNSAELDPSGEGVLIAVQRILVDHSDIKRVRVEGHTDNTGPEAYNQKLSENRARSVVAWLVKHGIAKDRLTSQGFGMPRPLVSNDSPEGRLQNRRVEFHIEEGQ
jgi:outer membrane protein OmpA-like peptidoglycan-associated protein